MQKCEAPTPSLINVSSLDVLSCLFSGPDVLPEMAKHLSDAPSAIADALAASLGLYVRDEGTESYELRLAARTF